MTDEYLQTPLVIWIQTFSIEPISYNDLIDGYFLNEVFQQIDSKCSLEGIAGKVEDVNDRLQNWEMLLRNIRSFYQEVLQQYIILKPPDIFLVCYQPDTASARDQIDAAILLLLGCAVQCEERGSYIQVIKGLHVDVQHSIMQRIKEVTDFSKSVLNVNIPLKDIDDSTLTLYTHLSSLINQRDAYIQEIKTLHQALNVISIDDLGRITLDGQWGIKAGPRGKSTNRLSLINLEMSSLVGQAEYKAIVRKLKQEILDKGDLITELEDEMDQLRKNLQKLKIENFDLTQQARQGKFYRDELDIYKEKAEVVEKLEREVQKYKDQLVEFDYLKDRVEELRVDNCLLMDGKKVLEGQVDSLKLKTQQLFDTEVELVRCKKSVEDFNREQEEYKERLRLLTHKLELLEREKEAKKRVSFMEDSLHAPLNFECANDGVGSLADQLLQASQSQIIALEAKLQKLELEMKDKFYFSENVLKAFDLDRVKIRSDLSDVVAFTDSVEMRTKDGSGDDDFLSREDLEKEVLKRLALLKDDNDRLKNHLHSSNELLGLNQDRIKSLESANDSLSSEKHQLLLSAESGERKVKNLLEERDRLESELLELKKMADVCLKRTRDLEDCLEEVKIKDEAYLQERIEFEKESKRLKALLRDKSAAVTELENSINEMNSELAQLRKASEEFKLLESKFHDLEVEVENLNQIKDLDKKLVMSLREELVSEKIVTQSLREELSRANKKCGAFMSGELVPSKTRVTEKLLEEKVLDNENQKKKIIELEESLEERKIQMEKLQSELNSLLKKEEMSATKDRTLIVTQRYGQSPGATQEILKLKENLSKTQKHRDSLMQEVSEMRRQVDALRSALDQQPQDDSAYIESMQNQLQKNQLMLANFQVEHSTIMTQNATLEEQVAQLKVTVSEGISKLECLTSERNSLEDNCRALQKLHDKLGVEFERLQEDHGTLKGVHRLLKTDLKSAREKILSLEKSLEKMKNCSNDAELVALKEENTNLTKTVDNLEIDNKNLSSEMRKCRMEMSRLKDSLQSLQKQVTDNRNVAVNLDAEIERLRRIEHMYNRTEEENMILSDQLRMYKTSMGEGNDVGTENHQQQQKSERLSEMKSKSSKNENQTSKSKKKTKNELTNSSKKNQSSPSDSKSSERSDSLPSIKKDSIIGSPMRKSQEDFISIESTPTQSESKTVSPFETITKFGDWRIKTVFKKNKSVDSAQQTSGFCDHSARKKVKRTIGTSDIDDETITLNQFLSECNQSPKSRRKFLIQKRVALDDDVFCDKELPLDPRPPVLFESSQSLTRCGRSEGNIFNGGSTQERNSTARKGRFERSEDPGTARAVVCDDASMMPAKRSMLKSTMNVLHHSKSFQEHFSERQPLSNPRVRNEFYGNPDSYEDQQSISKSKRMDTNTQCLGNDEFRKNSNIAVLRRKDCRELQPVVKKRIFTSEGVALEDVPYQPSEGVVKNLIKSYQKNNGNMAADDCQNMKETNSCRSTASQGFAVMRPKSAGPNHDRVSCRQLNYDQFAESENHPSPVNPKVCLVRPATATGSKVDGTSSHLYPRNAAGRNNEMSFQKSGPVKSKTLYEYSCV